MTTVPHERNKFIEELCQMVFDIFSDYWRLSTMYLNNVLTIPTNTKNQQPEHSSEEVYALGGELLTTFTNIVRAAFIPHTFKENQKQSADEEAKSKSLFLPWPIQHDAKIISQILPHCLRVCRYSIYFVSSVKKLYFLFY